MPREIDLEVGTLEDPDEGNDSVISPGIIQCEWRSYRYDGT